MPNATIKTYSDILVNEFGEIIRVNKIVAEREIAPQEKTVSFGKYSKKQTISSKVKSQEELCR